MDKKVKKKYHNLNTQSQCMGFEQSTTSRRRKYLDYTEIVFSFGLTK